MPIDDILDRLEDEERKFSGTEFLAPLVGYNQVIVRIAGVICRVNITAGLPPGEGYTGWAVLRSLSTRQAAFVRPATLGEITSYLTLFPAVRFILLRLENDACTSCWLALPAHLADRRIRVETPVILRLPEEGLERFETVIARFDGQEFWYERRDPTRDPAIAVFLREKLAEVGPDGLPPRPEELHKPGLSLEERNAYVLMRLLKAEASRDQEEARLSTALAHAGAELVSFEERGEVLTVLYTVDGLQHVSQVRKDELSVVSAGICLSGEDHRFDLTSLVGVLRQASEQGRLAHMDEDDVQDSDPYWNRYPS